MLRKTEEFISQGIINSYKLQEKFETEFDKVSDNIAKAKKEMSNRKIIRENDK